jgi:hypothetical protein
MGATVDTIGDVSDDGPPEASLYTEESLCNTRMAGKRGTMTRHTAEARRHDFRTELDNTGGAGSFVVVNNAVVALNLVALNGHKIRVVVEFARLWNTIVGERI